MRIALILVAIAALIPVTTVLARRRSSTGTPAPALAEFLSVVDDAFALVGQEATAAHPDVKREQVHATMVVLTVAGSDGTEMSFDVADDGIDIHSVGPEVASFGRKQFTEQRDFMVRYIGRLLTSRVEVAARRRSRSGCELRFIDSAGEVFGRNIYWNTDYRSPQQPSGPVFPPRS